MYLYPTDSQDDDYVFMYHDTTIMIMKSSTPELRTLESTSPYFSGHKTGRVSTGGDSDPLFRLIFLMASRLGRIRDSKTELVPQRSTETEEART